MTELGMIARVSDHLRRGENAGALTTLTAKIPSSFHRLCWILPLFVAALLGFAPAWSTSLTAVIAFYHMPEGGFFQYRRIVQLSPSQMDSAS